MAQVIVDIGGRNYPLSCRDGDEGHLQGLAAGIAAKAATLTASLGAMSETRLLLMSALMVADELHDLKNGSGTPPAADARLAALVARVEALAECIGT